MKKLIIFSLFFIGIMVCVVTCPDKEAHAETIMATIGSAIDEEVMQKADGNDKMGVGVAKLTSLLASGLSDLLLNQALTVDNYFVCSIGKILWDGEERIVSFGFMNHIFTMYKEDVKRKIEEAL